MGKHPTQVLFSENATRGISPGFNFADTVGTTHASRCYSPGSAQVDAHRLGGMDMGGRATIPPAPHVSASTKSVLGRRPHSEEETSDDYFQAIHGISACSSLERVQRKLMSNGLLEAVSSTGRGRQILVTRSPTKSGWNSEAAESGAGKLAAPNAHEVSPRFLPGPRVQEELVETTVQKQPWREGCEGGATRSDANSAVLSGNAKDEARGDFTIPKGLSKRHRALLRATSEELARGTVHELKCRLCTRANFNSWSNFNRHCDFMEAHPLQILFCEHCGDFFAREFSLDRHRKSRPQKCRQVTTNEARAKREATERAHETFEAKLEQRLGTDEGIEMPFAQLVKAMHPSTSKKGSRQQCRLKEPQA